MSEPIEHGGKLSEAEERRSEIFIARADAAVAFDAADEIFDPVAALVVAAMEGYWPAAVALGRDADAGALPTPSRAERRAFAWAVSRALGATHLALENVVFHPIAERPPRAHADQSMSVAASD